MTENQRQDGENSFTYLLPKLDNLANLPEKPWAVLCKSAVPANDRKVILHDIAPKHGAVTYTVRFTDNKWVDVLTGFDHTPRMTWRAAWSEMILNWMY